MTRTTPILLGCLGALFFAILGFQSASQSSPRSVPGAETVAEPPLTASQVVRRMSLMYAARRSALKAYTAKRHYHLEYHGLGHKTADMEVAVHYHGSQPKDFTILRERGSGMLRHHVLEPLIREERKQARLQYDRGSAFVPENYAFTLVDFPRAGGPRAYVLAVTPRKKHSERFLFRGKIWVDPADFGIERAEGRPLRSPSWWISSYRFVYKGQKVGEFWLPASDHGTSHIRFWGHAELDVTCGDFELTDVEPLRSPMPAETPADFQP